MRYLLFINCCWLLVCTACSSSYKKMQRVSGNDADCVRSFQPVFTTALYNAQVNVTGKHLSGILIIKTMPDSSTRMVFSNEAGFKFFDFGFDKKGFKVYYIVSQMNKKPVIKTLRKDFELVLMKHIHAASYYAMKEESEYYYVFPDGKDHYYYVTDSACSRLIRMERGSKKKKVVEAVMETGKDGMPDTIGIRHNNFSFDIGLKRLEHDPQ